MSSPTFQSFKISLQRNVKEVVSRGVHRIISGKSVGGGGEKHATDPFPVDFSLGVDIKVIRIQTFTRASLKI